MQKNDRPSIENSVTVAEAPSAESTHNNKDDSIKRNRDSSQRSRISNKFKATMIQFYESEYCEENVAKFVKQHRSDRKFKKMLRSGEKGWRHPSTGERMFKESPKEKHNDMK